MKFLINVFILLIITCMSYEVLSQPAIFNNSKDQYQNQFSSSEDDKSSGKYWKTFSTKFLGTFDIGKETSMPCWPEDSSFGYAYGGAPVDGYGFGIDFHVTPLVKGGSDFLLTIFIDVGSPVAKPIEIDNLFYDGWTWSSSAGEHAILPYRIGLAIGL